MRFNDATDINESVRTMSFKGQDMAYSNAIAMITKKMNFPTASKGLCYFGQTVADFIHFGLFRSQLFGCQGEIM